MENNIKYGLIIQGKTYECVVTESKTPCEECAFVKECGDCPCSKMSTLCMDMDNIVGVDGNYKTVIFKEI